MENFMKTYEAQDSKYNIFNEASTIGFYWQILFRIYLLTMYKMILVQ